MMLDYQLALHRNPFRSNNDLLRKTDNWEEGQTRAGDQDLQPADAPSPSHVFFHERIKHLTWAWYTFTMSSGGMGLLLHATPHQFHGLRVIGDIFFILTLVAFVLLTAGIVTRFAMTPAALRKSLMHPTESLFFPCFQLSVATILSNAAGYGAPSCGPWLAVALRACFWLYVAVAVLSAVVQFFVLFSGAHLPIQSMTPGWILPIFPAMLTGTLAGSIAPLQSSGNAMPILVAGVACQGLGWIVATLVFPLYLGRLMQDGLPAPPMRPGMFIAAGPASYTSVAIIGMARAIPADYGYFKEHPLAPEVLRILALWVSVWIWCLAFWFFAFSVMAILASVVLRPLRKELRFSMAWWAFVFPNVGFTLATGSIGEELGSEGIKWVASSMAILLVIIWLGVLVAQIRAIKRRKILWPGRDEDK